MPFQPPDYFFSRGSFLKRTVMLTHLCPLLRGRLWAPPDGRLCLPVPRNSACSGHSLPCSLAFHAQAHPPLFIHLSGCPLSLPAPIFSVQFSSVAQLCLTLCDPMAGSTPGFPVHHQLPELTQTHVHRVGDATQPSHPLSSPSPPAFNLSQHQGLFPMSQFSPLGGQSIGVSTSSSVLPMNIQD